MVHVISKDISQTSVDSALHISHLKKIYHILFFKSSRLHKSILKLKMRLKTVLTNKIKFVRVK